VILGQPFLNGTEGNDCSRLIWKTYVKNRIKQVKRRMKAIERSIIA
jgi:hypothetical protein